MSNLDDMSIAPSRDESLVPSEHAQDDFNGAVINIESTLYCTLQALMGGLDAVRLQRDGVALLLGRSVEAVRAIGGAGEEDVQQEPEARRKRRRETQASQASAERVTTNNNRRKIKEQEKRKVTRLADAYRGSDDEREDLEIALENVEQNGEGLLWLRARPGITMNLDNATKFMNNVRSICGPDALWEIRTIVQYWRQTHRLDGLDSVFLPMGSQLSQRSQRPAFSADLLMDEDEDEEGISLADASERLWRAFQATERVETFGLWHKVHQRLRLAFLWRRYQTVVALMSEDFALAATTASEHNRSALSPERLAKDALFKKLYERLYMTMQAIDGEGNGEEVRYTVGRDIEKKKLKFERQLQGGKRYSELVKIFGSPILMGIPSTIPDIFIERMSMANFEAFCDALKLYNPYVQNWGMVVPMMDQMVNGRAPPDKFFGLERITDEDEVRSMKPDEQVKLLTF